MRALFFLRLLDALCQGHGAGLNQPCRVLDSNGVDANAPAMPAWCVGVFET